MMEGEDGESTSEGAFGNKPVWSRIATVAAGPIFNFIMAFVFSLIVIGAVGFDVPTLTGVTEGYPAAEAGLKEGDVITRLNSKTIHFSREMSFYMAYHAGEEIDVTYIRDGEKQTAHLVPLYDEEQEGYLIGIQYDMYRERGKVLEEIRYSVYE